ncbi:MAG TPA: methylated-DNA--[protein]-cysteine S-methyltransferase [Dongiaceae bacterium]|nr:methylated-DNA--[protein]-cysteine S-methyltransferase [Dongiaceae bacterium]
MSASHYERIAQVIRYLDAHHAEQPGLAVLAAQLGLNPFHFHRLFSEWAGVTPKDFLQCLTLAHAKTLLQDGQSVLDSALEAGFSGPGRLHDLCVTLEAASPGEVKSGGKGWSIRFGFAETPFGECIAGEGPRGVCYLAFVDGANRQTATAALEETWPQAELARDDQVVARLAAQVFHRSKPEQARPAIRAFVRGSAFQVRVWKALLRVPPGSLVTYGRLAAAIGQPAAARAVGSAVGNNPLAFLIPCHRVIRETGLLGGYRWGPARKRAMLAWETAAAGCR